jgi:hypothetical protein
MDNFENTKGIIGDSVKDVTHTSLIGAETIFSFGLGGATAKSYNGATMGQETMRWLKNSLNSPRSQFNLVPRFDTGRVIATSLVNTLAIQASWNAGLMIGSGITTLSQGVECE